MTSPSVNTGRRRHSLLIAVVVLAALLAGWHTPARAGELASVLDLAKAGAPDLALQFLDREQPDPKVDAKGWMRWERARVGLYFDGRDWKSASARLSKLPPGLPADFVLWAHTQLAAADIARGDGRAALAVLRRLLWGPGAGADPKRFAHWRRMVIQAYLADNDVADANTAMLRYQQDYGDGNAGWRLLRARVLLRAAHPRQAQQLLARDRSAAARALYYLARLDDHSEAAVTVYRHARRLARGRHVKAAVAYRLWAVAARAAQRAGNAAGEIEALSRALTTLRPGARPEPLFPVSGRALWRAYLGYGRAIGNRMQLLVGQDQRWYQAAERLEKHKQPVAARALYAVLAVDGGSVGGRQLGNEAFAHRVARSKGGVTLLRALYLSRNPYVTADALPVRARRVLVDDALSHSDIRLASRLMGPLTAAPKGVDPVFWQMRRARILIMGGKVGAGVAALHQLLKTHRKLPRKQIERLMQVLFDLQSIGRNKDAIALFRQLPMAGQDGQLRREVLYWTADSFKALGQYQEAARLYLRSATLLDIKAMDQWAQSARYQAAEALARAGLRADAKRVYTQLLQATKDPARRAVLRSKLQHLWLRPGAGAATTLSQRRDRHGAP